MPPSCSKQWPANSLGALLPMATGLTALRVVSVSGHRPALD